MNWLLPSTPARGFTPQQLVLRLWLTTFLASMGVSLVVVLPWFYTPATVIDEKFLSGFTVPEHYFYAFQPGKNCAYFLGCLSFPFFLLLAARLSTFWVLHLNQTNVRRSLAVTSAFTGLFLLSCTIPVFWCSDPPLPQMPPSRLLFSDLFASHQLFSIERLFSGLLLLGLAAFLCLGQRFQKSRLPVFACLVLLLALLIPLKVYAPAEIEDSGQFLVHFNVVIHSLSQSANGRHLWVHYPNIYGGYVEFLGPILRILPRNIETLLLLFGGLDAIAIGLVMVTIYVVVEDVRALLMASLAILGLQYVIYLLSGDNYYQYYVVRQLCPSAGLLIGALYLRGPQLWSYLVMTLGSALASIWNLDTGLILWGSWTMLLAIKGGIRRDGREMVLHTGTQIATLILVWALMWTYLRLVTGFWPDPHLLFKFQRLFGGSGFNCLPLLFPDVWVIPLLIYIAALGWTFIRALERDSSWKSEFTVFASILGVGLSSYYFGRSAPSNLTMVLYPAVIVLAVLWEEVGRHVTAGRFSTFAHAFLAPFIGLIGWWSLVLVLFLPDLAERDVTMARFWEADRHTPFFADLDFIRQHTVPHESIYILGNQSGFYYYMTDTYYPSKLPSNFDLFWSKDVDLLTNDITQHHFTKLFDDDNFPVPVLYRPEIYEKIRRAVSDNYVVSATSSTGHLKLLTPKVSADTAK